MINRIFMVLATFLAHAGGRCPDDLGAEWTPPLLEPARRATLRVALRDAAALPNDLFKRAWYRFLKFIDETQYDFDGFVVRNMSEGVDLDARDALGRTALMHAAMADNARVYWALLKQGAAVDARDVLGRTAADYATLMRAHEHVVDPRHVERHLTLNGCYVGDRVWAAMAAPNDDALKELLREGLFPDYYDLALGKSLLTNAAAGGHLARMQLLLDYGANPRFRNRNAPGEGPTYPIIAAAANRQRAAIQLLIRHGASINDGGFYNYEINPVRMTLWNLASASGDHEDRLAFLDWLLNHGADPDAHVTGSGRRDLRPLDEFITEIFRNSVERGSQAAERKTMAIERLRQHEVLKARHSAALQTLERPPR